MRPSSQVFLLSLIAFAGASPVSHNINTTLFKNVAFNLSKGEAASCVTGEIPIPISFEAEKWLFEKTTDSLSVTDFVLNVTTTDPNHILDFSEGTTLIQKTYGIWVKYCVPSSGLPNSVDRAVQILTHGGTLDHTYWDFAPGYSYVDVAARAGMVTEHPDPLLEVQTPASVEVLHQLVTMLRSGSFSPQFSKVIGVGHSIGSKETEAVISKYPSDFDAIIHTGYAYENAAGAGSVVATGLGSPKDVDHLKHLPDGYLVPKSVEGIHICFFKYPNSDPQILSQTVRHMQTESMGEMLIPPGSSFWGNLTAAPTSRQHDYVVCGQSCVTPQNLAAQSLETAYASADRNLSEPWISPGAGHNCHTHLNAPDVSAKMVNWVKKLGWNT
ncbi:catalytic protein [Colletotrichum asianum]